MKKILVLSLTVVLALTLLTSCGGGSSSGAGNSGRSANEVPKAADNYGGGIPSGTYKPVAVTMPGMGRTVIDDTLAGMYMGYSIIVDGNNFSMSMAGMTSTCKYSYSNGKLTLHESSNASVSLDITYSNNMLIWSLGGGMNIEMARS